MDDFRPTPFIVGRHDDQAALTARLVDPATRLITIVGIGGVGKTTLAKHVLESSRSRFSGQVFLVRLAGINDPALVPFRLLSLLGVVAPTGADPEEVILAHLASAHALLVLDHVEHLPQATGLFASIANRCPSVWQLATSRVPLDLAAETVFPLAPLPVPLSGAPTDEATLTANPAAHLLLHHLRQAQPSFVLTPENAKAVVRICQKLDGIPLALELSAHRLSALFSVQEIDRHLTVHLVEASTADGASGERVSVPALLQWSFDRLDPTQQAVCRVLSVMAGGATVDSVLALLSDLGRQDLSLARVIAALEQLARLGFVRVEQRTSASRFFMLRLVREFIRDLETDGGPTDEELLSAHASHFVVVAGAIPSSLDGADPNLAREQMADELDNFRQAMTWWNGRGQGERCLDIAGVTWTFWRQQGLLAEILQWLERGLNACAESASVTRARAFLYVGHSIQADAARRGLAYQRAFDQFHALDDLIGQTGALDSLSLVQLDGGDLQAAEQSLRRALALARRSGDPKSIGFIVDHLGGIQLRRGDFSGAKQSLTHALTIWNDLLAEDNAAFVLFELGRLERQRHLNWPAEEYLRDSEALFQKTGSLPGQGYALQELGQALLAQGKVEPAYRAFHAALDLIARCKLRDDESTSAIEGLACVATDQQPLVAAHLLTAAAHWRARLGFTRLSANDELVNAAWQRLRRSLPADRLKRIETVAEFDEWDETLQRALDVTLTWNGAPVLTGTELKVLRLTAKGLQDKQIGKELGSSENTVRTHQRNIRQKLDAANRTDAIRIARELGLLDE